MFRSLSFFIIGLFCTATLSAQYNWKLEKDEDGIKVYTSSVAGSSYKSVRVECTIAGTYSKLINILMNVEHFNEWVYHNKTSRLIKKINAYDLIYYSETHMPWPLSNRDVIIRLQIKTDSLPRFLMITGKSVSGLEPEHSSRVRVPHYSATWKVTMPTANTLHISYIVEVDPGGSIPAWIANMYAEKGPFGSFSNLKDLMK